MAPRAKKRTTTAGGPTTHVDPSASCSRTDTYTLNGRTLTRGQTWVAIHGEPGRFKFWQAVTTPAGAHWLDFIGGPKGEHVFRSFYPERVARFLNR